MPDRIVRDELLESEKWLSLKDNADRLAFIALLLKADSLGNFSAEPFRLMRLWRDFGINTVLLVAKTMSELADHDLVRPYQVGDKLLLHIPRFGQRLRHLTRVYPPSPWTTDEQKQLVMNNSPVSRQSLDRLGSVEVKRSEVKRSKTLAPSGASEFETFWQVYPRKKSKGQAEKAWAKHANGNIEAIMVALVVAKQSADWSKDGGKWIPYPATWLNAKGWLDEQTSQPAENKRQWVV